MLYLQNRYNALPVCIDVTEAPCPGPLRQEGEQREGRIQVLHLRDMEGLLLRSELCSDVVVKMSGGRFPVVVNRKQEQLNVRLQAHPCAIAY